MATAKEIRSDILELLFQTEKIETLEKMRQQLRIINKQVNNLEAEVKTEPAFFAGVRPIREEVTLQEIMDEQNYQPCSYEEFRASADKIDWGDVTLDELLNAIK